MRAVVCSRIDRGCQCIRFRPFVYETWQKRDIASFNMLHRDAVRLAATDPHQRRLTDLAAPGGLLLQLAFAAFLAADAGYANLGRALELAYVRAYQASWWRNRCQTLCWGGPPALCHWRLCSGTQHSNARQILSHAKNAVRLHSGDAHAIGRVEIERDRL